MHWLRPEIVSIEPTGIARVALPRFDDPDVIPLWIGEGDLVTPIHDSMTRTSFRCGSAKAIS